MQYLTVILFFIYAFGLGYLVSRFNKSLSPENVIMKIGIGLGAMPVLGVLLNVFKIPLGWKIFLVLSVIMPAVDLFRHPGEFKPGRPKGSGKIILVLLSSIFLVHLLFFCIGAFSYPWLEDDDSWAHAAGIKYVSVEKNIDAGQGEFKYINPYPPGYDIVLGVIHQTSPSLYWTLKFFNALIVSLGLLFFYYFAKDLYGGNEPKALTAAFFLAVVPCYLTHFIWAHSLVITLFFPAFYAIRKSIADRRFILPAVIVISGIFLTQPTKSIKFVIMVLLMALAGRVTAGKWPRRYFVILILAGLAALTWWLPAAKDVLSGNSHLIAGNMAGGTDVNLAKTDVIVRHLFNPSGGSATRAYNLSHYVDPFCLKNINSPVGTGWTLLLLAASGVLFSLKYMKSKIMPERTDLLTVLFWFIFTFIGMNSVTFNLPAGLFAFRFWLLFAIPVVLLAAEGTFHIFRIIQTLFLKIVVLFILFLSIIVTAAYPKIVTNVSRWPYGVGWNSNTEIRGHIWLRENLPANTRVFALTANMFVLGNDMSADFWSKRYKRSFARAADLDIDVLHKNLKDSAFEYVIIGERDFNALGVERVRRIIGTLKDHAGFREINRIKDKLFIFEVL